MTHDPMPPDRDHALGHALRAALEPGDDPAAFAARVMARADVRPGSMWAELAGATRWGVAAAVAAIAVAVAVVSTRPSDVSLDAALARGNDDAIAALLTHDTAPDSDILFEEADAP